MTSFIASHCALTAARGLRTLGVALGRDITIAGLPAHPGGPPWDATRDYHDQAYEAFCVACPDGRLDLFGHSLGGTIALRFALRHPKRVRSLAVFEPVLFAAADPKALAENLDDMAPFDAALKRGDDAAAAEVFNRHWGTGAPWQALPDRTQKMITRLIPIIPATEPVIVNDWYGFVDQLAQCQVPTLIMHQPKPPQIVAAIAAGMQARMPHAKTEAVVGNGAHMMPLVDPAAFVPVLQRFWAQSP